MVPPLSSAKTPEEHLARLKDVWAYSVLSEEGVDVSLARSLCMHPFSKFHPMGRVLSYLLARQIREPLVPLVLLHPLLPLYESYQLLILWAIAGEKERVEALGAKVLALHPLNTLWTQEKTYQEEEAHQSYALIEKVYGGKEVFFGEEAPFFAALLKMVEKKGISLSPWPPCEHRIEYPELGLSLQRTKHFTAALCLAGEKTPLGVFSTDGAVVRAFGPQTAPLSRPDHFGVLREPDSQPLSRWSSMAADPEVWMEIQSTWEEKGQWLRVRFFGLKPEKSTFFCFYIKASVCHVDGEEVFPRTLRRLKKEARRAVFGKTLMIESLLPLPMELIPLAGEGGFWNCDYLLAFSVPSFEGRAEFRISSTTI